MNKRQLNQFYAAHEHAAFTVLLFQYLFAPEEEPCAWRPMCFSSAKACFAGKPGVITALPSDRAKPPNHRVQFCCKPFPHLGLGGQSSKHNCKRSSAWLHGPQRIISARLSTQFFGSGYPHLGTLFLSISDDFVPEIHWQIKEKRGSEISIFLNFPCLCLFC